MCMTFEFNRIVLEKKKKIGKQILKVLRTKIHKTEQFVEVHSVQRY